MRSPMVLSSPGLLRRRRESNPRTRFCRPLPVPLGYAAGNPPGYRPTRLRPFDQAVTQCPLRSPGGHVMQRAGQALASVTTASLLALTLAASASAGDGESNGSTAEPIGSYAVGRI